MQPLFTSGFRAADYLTNDAIRAMTESPYATDPAKAVCPQPRVVLGLAGLVFSIAPAQAQGKLDATYTASLAGIPLGRGAWVIDIGEDQYSAVTSGVTTGLLNVFASGQGTGIARGYVSNGTLVPSTYGAQIKAAKWSEDLRMTIVGGVVKELSIEPTPPPQPERIPVTEAHRKGVTDPMTGSLVRVAGNGELVSPEACRRTTSIFDGRLRYDLQPCVQAHREGEGRQGLCRPRGGLRGLFHARCRLYSRSAGHQAPDRAARYGSVAGADRGHAHPCAVSHDDPDPDGDGRVAGQPVPHDRPATAADTGQCEEPVGAKSRLTLRPVRSPSSGLIFPNAQCAQFTYRTPDLVCLTTGVFDMLP